MGSSLVFWICLFVGCTAVPMTIDLLRIFFPASLSGSGRLVASWQRPVLLAMVACLCVWAYYAFWSSVLPYSHDPWTGTGPAHVLCCTWLWVMSVWNYAVCAAADPGAVVPSVSISAATEDGRCDATGDFQQQSRPQRVQTLEQKPSSRYCAICEHHVQHLDHHCPFTGGCVGVGNMRFFLLFVLHCSLGCGYATLLAWAPFRDCVLLQCNLPALGLVRTPPPSESACVALGGRSLLVLPALMLFVSLSGLAVFHGLLLGNGLTTIQYVRRWRARGLRSVRDLVLLHGEAETDKWQMLWGQPADRASSCHRLRILLLPSLPARGTDGHIALSAGVGSSKAWLGAAAVLALLLLMLPAAVSMLEGVAARMTYDSSASHS